MVARERSYDGDDLDQSWQAGQIIGTREPDQVAAPSALQTHFAEVGLGDDDAQTLATELTASW